METGIIIAIITGLFSIAGVVISNYSSNRKIEHTLEISQAVTDNKIEELTREVREHNNFARRMPVLEEKLSNLANRVKNLEEKQ